MDVFRQRLEDEYDASIIVTAPTVPYKGNKFLCIWNGHSHYQQVVYKDRDVYISNPTEFPNVTDTATKVKEIQEPVVNASIIVPQGKVAVLLMTTSKWRFGTEYLGEMMDLCYSRRAEELDHQYLESGENDSSRVILTCIIPLSEIVTDFFDQLKSRSSGFASFEWVLW
jgi:translation elongation factor EF-4